MVNNDPRGFGWTAQQTLPGPNTATNTATLAWAATTAFTLGQVITLAGGDMWLCTTAGTSAGTIPAAFATSTMSRNDVATTVIGSNVVLDASIAAVDAGRLVVGVGIPGGTYVGTVTPGVSFLLSNVATGQAGSVVAAAGGVQQIVLFGPRVADSGAVWTMLGSKFADGYKVQGQNYVTTPPTRFDLIINQKPA